METAVEENHNEPAVNTVLETPAETKPPPPPPQNPPTQDPPKKSKKEERSKRDDKTVDQFMKSLNSVSSYEEKFSVVCKKYAQTADENKKLQFYIKQSDKRYALLSKEKEQLQHEYNKTILVKSKLENLCRELQKQNKAIKEESLLKIREEEERRKETQAKFQNTLSEITTLLQQNNEKNAKLRDDNISMSEKFKSVVQQYQLREQQVDKMAKQMALESQLSDAKMQKASLEHQAEKERIVAEMEQLKVTVAQYRAKILELQGTETALRSQLGVYTDKYDEFQNALVKSNQVFGGFKEQMEKMSKKIKKLEKESLSWKSRWETSQTALLDMCGERQASEERVAATTRQLHHMQSLCRTLQAERTVLLSALKENNIERPPLPSPPPPSAPPAAPPASNAKAEAMAANCAQLRQSLAELQTQLNVLTKSKLKEAPVKPEKAKKSKSKKNKDKQAQKDDKTKTEENGEAAPVADDKAPEKDDNEIETLIEAMNSADINLCDLEVVNEDNELDSAIVNEVLEIESNEFKNKEVNGENNNAEAQLNASEAKLDVEAIVNEISAVNEVGAKVNDVSTEKLNEAEAKVNEVEAKVNEVHAEKVKEVNSNTKVAQVSNEATSNDEVSHIPEVKPISAKEA